MSLPPTNPAPRNPTGIKLPPPLVFLMSILLGIGIQSVIPVGLIGSGLCSFPGLVLSATGLLLVVLTVRELFKARTTIRPDRGATTLLTAGPFRISRNPIYLGFAMLQAGIALSLDNMWILLLVGVDALLLNRLVIAREEAYLLATFGQSYRDYCGRVRRWI